jgi:hypothetical protein
VGNELLVNSTEYIHLLYYKNRIITNPSMTPRMMIHETMMKLYNIEIYHKTIPCNGQVYKQGNVQVYERNNDEIGEMGNVSSMFHIFWSILRSFRYAWRCCWSRISVCGMF